MSERPLKSEGENFHQLARERAELRRMQKDEPGLETAEIIADELESLNKRAEEFTKLRQENPVGARSRLKSEREAYTVSSWLDEASIGEELGEAYEIISASSSKLDEISDFETSQLRKGSSDPTVQNVNSRVLVKVRERKAELERNVALIKQEDPMAWRGFELVSYKKGIHEEGHIAPTPSVADHLHQIGIRMISGKPMFLHGPTGTGKTSLARFASEHFAGQKAEMVYCNPQTRESNIWGKQGIRPAEGLAGERGGIQTVDIYGPLARAMQAGKVVIFDEFTALPKEQMVFIKGIFNAKVGDTVNIMGNGVVKIAPGFQMIFTANLKSEKNPERQELPPEIAREFEQNNLEVGYTPAPEAYDIMLARLMNSDGSVDFSYYDLNETLPRFCSAMAEIQLAYTDKTSDETARLTGTMDPSGKKSALKKFVFTQGTVEAVLEAWKIEKQSSSAKTSFVEFLDQRLKTALTFKEYPPADRLLATKILASKGFLRTLSPQDLDLPAEVFNFEAGRKLRGNDDALAELKTKSGAEAHIPLKDLTDLDPFNLRQKRAVDLANQFLPPEEQKDPAGPAGPEDLESIRQKLQPFFEDTFKNYWNYSDDTISKFTNSPELRAPKDILWDNGRTDTDASKFGEYSLNPETQSTNWDTVSPDKIKIEKLPKNMEKKSLAEVGKYIVATYGAKYYIPGIEYWKYIIENPDKAPPGLKDGNYHFFFGSILRHSNGHWFVPLADWLGSKSRFDRSAYWLGIAWGSDCRVVLLEK
jgi:hypothetical protein